MRTVKTGQIGQMVQARRTNIFIGFAMRGLVYAVLPLGPK